MSHIPGWCLIPVPKLHPDHNRDPGEANLKACVRVQMGDKDMGEEETKRYVADLLNSQLAHPSFQLTPDQVRLHAPCIQSCLVVRA